MKQSILINFPTNIGDTIMSLPVLDRVKGNYPESKITAVASAKTKDFLTKNNFIDEIIVFDKSWKAIHKWRFTLSLRGQYTMIVDLKNSLLPILLGAKKKTPYIRKTDKSKHAVLGYLDTIISLCPKECTGKKSSFLLPDTKKHQWDSLIQKPSIFIACSSRSQLKRYPVSRLTQIIEKLKQTHKIIIIGEESDRELYKDIADSENITNLAGETEIADIFYLFINYAICVLSVDSSALHIAGYLNIPVVALFGPTDQKRYGPWSKTSTILRNDFVACAPCNKSLCNFKHECMNISPQKIIDALLATIEKTKQSRSFST
ncbi:MAG: glycosyltransferase family 9 protein [Candidatus Omnitrophota bacterium]